MHFECSEYMMVPEAKSSELFGTVKVRGFATKITSERAPWNHGVAEKKYVVEDLRVPEPNVIYGIDNGIVPPLGSASIEKARQRALQKQKEREEALRSNDILHRSRFIPLLCLIVISFVPLIFFLRKRGIDG